MTLYRTLLAAILLAFLPAAPGIAQDIPAGSGWQCVTFARAFSGIQLFGNAYGWWDQAAGKYERGHDPKIGAVMVLPAHAGMRVGHVATVSDLVDARTIKVTHANWSRRGGVEQNVQVIDVSAANDWSQVRIWWGPMHGLGLTSYPVSGFIYNHADAAPREQVAIADQPLQLASLNR